MNNKATHRKGFERHHSNDPMGLPEYVLLAAVVIGVGALVMAVVL